MREKIFMHYKINVHRLKKKFAYYMIKNSYDFQKL